MMKLLRWVGLVMCVLVMVATVDVGCASPKETCSGDFSKTNLNPDKSTCTKACECNNLGYTGACVDGACRAVERQACATRGATEACVHDALSCRGTRECAPEVLGVMLWGDCLCGGEPTGEVQVDGGEVRDGSRPEGQTPEPVKEAGVDASPQEGEPVGELPQEACTGCVAGWRKESATLSAQIVRFGLAQASGADKRCIWLVAGDKQNEVDGSKAVYWTELGADGAFSPIRSLLASALKRGRIAPGVLVHEGSLYVFGGKAAQDELVVLQAEHKADCTLGTWKELTQRLPQALVDGFGYVVLAHGGKQFLAVMGGRTSETDTQNKAVYLASLSQDGPTDWKKSTSPLKFPQWRTMAGKLGDYVYLVSGKHDDDATTPTLGKVQFAKWEQGALGTWQETTSPAALWGGTLVVAQGKLYLFGGANAKNEPSEVVYAAQPGADGMISAWTKVGTFPSEPWGGGRFEAQPLLSGEFLYLFGGYASNSFRYADEILRVRLPSP